MEITKIFDKKKRDLSNKSNHRDDSERPRESSLNDSIAANTDNFTEALKSEDCVAIFYTCMKKLEEEMKKVPQMCEKQDSQIKGESQLNSLSEAMNFMTNKSEEYERERQEKDKIIDSMKSDMVNMNKKVGKLEMLVDRQGQYSPRNCLLPHGITEGERENTDLVLETLNQKMKIDLTPSDLGRTPRIG